MAVLELTTFRLADGVSEDAFLAADERARTRFLYQQAGLSRATTAKGAAGEWLLAVLWASVEHADAAATAAATDDDAVALDRVITDRAVRRYEPFD